MEFINLITISIYITYFKTHKPHIFYLLFAIWTETKRFSLKGASIYIMNPKKKKKEKKKEKKKRKDSLQHYNTLYDKAKFLRY